MSLIVKAGGESTYTPHPEGQFAARCIDVQDLGYEEVTYDGKTKVQYKIRLVFFCGEWTEEKEIEVEGETVKRRFPMTVGKKFTASLHDRATLRAFAKSWRGKDFDAQTLKDGFDFEKMCDAPAFIQVGHFQYDGKTFAGIDSIMRAPKGVDVPDTPEGYQRLKDREDWAGPAPHPNMSDPTPAPEPEPADDDDDLPF